MTDIARAQSGGDALASLARSVTSALGSLVTPEGRLKDSEAWDGWSPDDHYGHLGTALALYLVDHNDARVPRLLDHWLALPAARRGHGPFNHLLGRLLRDATRSANDEANAERATRVVQAARLRRHYPSNNWSVLAQLCRLLDSTTTADRERATCELVRLYRRWMTEAGAFVDFPARSYRPGEGATPICYHHKALFVATVALVHTGDAGLAAIVEKLVAWALMTCDEEGYAGGFGRSTHALFGDACLLFSLRVLAPVADGSSALSAAETVLLRRLDGQRRPDGLLGLNPSGSDGWDGYMHLTVYNAWIAALLSWAPTAAANGAELASRLKLETGPILRDDADAGLHRVDGTTAEALLITSRGQPAQSLGRADVELRYAGGIPFHMTLRGLPRIAPPARLTLSRALEEPALAGWVPLFQYGEGVFTAAYDHVMRQSDGGTTHIEMNGHPVPATQATPRRAVERVLQAIDWRLLDGRLARRASVNRPRQRQIHVKATLAYNPGMQTLEQTLRIHNASTTGLRLLNPGGHALLGPVEAVETTFDSDEAESPQHWRQTALETSLPGATGYCLDPVTIPAGASYAHRLTIRWPA